MEFIFASSNLNKLKEFEQLLSDSQLRLKAPPHNLDVPEVGTTLYENAYSKAFSYYNEFNHPVFSDDSGLFINSLPDLLGVDTANFGADCKNYFEKCSLLLNYLEKINDRSAYFACVLCFFLSPKEYYFFEGRLNGNVAKEVQGDAGFGYDPIFLPDLSPSSSLAASIDWKMKHSHRAQAVQLAKNFFLKMMLENKVT